MCVCVCVCVYVCVCVSEGQCGRGCVAHVGVSACLCVWLSQRVLACCVTVRWHVSVCVRARMFRFVRMCACVCVCVRVFVRLHDHGFVCIFQGCFGQVQVCFFCFGSAFPLRSWVLFFRSGPVRSMFEKKSVRVFTSVPGLLFPVWSGLVRVSFSISLCLQMFLFVGI